jgi:hypothetical protein
MVDLSRHAHLVSAISEFSLGYLTSQGLRPHHHICKASEICLRLGPLHVIHRCAVKQDTHSLSKGCTTGLSRNSSRLLFAMLTVNMETWKHGTSGVKTCKIITVGSAKRQDSVVDHHDQNLPIAVPPSWSHHHGHRFHSIAECLHR